MRKTWIVLFLLTLVVAACTPGQSPQQAQAQVETAVAQTVVAQQQVGESVALTVAAQNPLATPVVDAFTATPTSIPLAFPTLTPIVPTITPFPALSQPSSSGGGGSGGGVTYVADYACDIINARPYDNTVFARGKKFDIKWTIVNTGTKTWPAGYDVKYFSGPKMTTTTLVEIPVQMKPRDQYVINLDAVVPDQKGFQVMTWSVEGQICYPYVAIIVK